MEEKILTKSDLKVFLKKDSKNYKDYYNTKCSIIKVLYHQLHTSPISDQWYIWKYIETMRRCEYYINNDTIWHKLIKIWYLYKLRKISRITGFQIPPGTIGPGVTIWHWGVIIINPSAKLGCNCTLNPNIVIGQKRIGELAPSIGNNVFIGSGAKIIGDIKIGDNVTIAPNAVVVDDLDDNIIVGGIPSKVLGHNLDI